MEKIKNKKYYIDLEERRKALLTELSNLWKEYKRLNEMRWSSAHRDMQKAVGYEIEDIIETLRKLL